MLKYRLKKLPRKKTIVWLTILLLFAVSMSSIVRYYAAWSSSEHYSANVTTGIGGENNSTVFINDLEADWNYYEGLNYTRITSKTNMPTYANTYNKNTLAAVHIIYNGADINNSNLVGYVSEDEQQYIFEYYKYYPINTTDNTVTIELIDNPYTDRPYGYGFNGWVCNNSATGITTNICQNSVLSYDDDYYTRYIKVSLANAQTVNGEKVITLQLNASWVGADIETSVNNLNDKSMQQVQSVQHNIYINYEEYTTIGYNYLDDTIVLNPTRRQAPRNTRMGNGNGRIVYTKGNNGTNYTIANAGTTCPNQPNQACYFYYIDDNAGYYELNATLAVFIPSTPGATANGNTGTVNNNVTGNDVFNYVDVNSPVAEWQARNDNIGKQTDPLNLNNAGAYYYKVGDLTSAQRTSGLYYQYSGKACTSSTCNNTAEAQAGYKLIQYGDPYSTAASEPHYMNANISAYTTYVPQYDPDTGQELLPPIGATRMIGDTCRRDFVFGRRVACQIDDSSTYAVRLTDYYYLVTRDTNIIDGGAIGTAPTKPLTLDGGTYSAGTVGDDLAIINSTISNNIDARFNNFKVGRNNTMSNNNYVFNGGTGSVTSGDYNNKVIIESGTYRRINSYEDDDNNTGCYQNAYGGTYNNIHGKYIYGSDYDRARKDNSKLTVTEAVSGSRRGTNTTSDGVSSDIVIKSGKFGTDGDSASDYTYGIYVGSWHCSTGNTALRSLTVEGGVIFNINGGPGVARNAGNAVAIYIKGGQITNIVGGAGQTETFGNRIISVTGGRVANSVAGGSNGSVNSGGAMSDDTLVYIGGNAIIGYKTSESTLVDNANNWASATLYGVIKGSVYGAGLGQSGSTDDGLVDNSHVIINGGTIYGSVFGGGNYGSVGSTDDYSGVNTNIHVELLAGTVEGSVYGASNRADSGYGTGNGGTTKLANDYYGFTSNHTVTTVDRYSANHRQTCNSYYGCSNYYGTWGSDYYSNESTTRTSTGTIPAGNYLADGTYLTAPRVCDSTVPGVNRTDSNQNFGNWNYSSGGYGGYPEGSTRTRTESFDINYSCTYYSISSSPMYHTGDNYNANNIYLECNNGICVAVTPELDVTNTYRHTITIDLKGTTVEKSIYGGSNNSGEVRGNVFINLYNGNVSEENQGVYGGGYGDATSVNGNITIKSLLPSGLTNEDLDIYNVYGGSALGAVNSKGKTTITIDGGKFNTIYGGGEGNNNTAPTNSGAINVEIKKGEVIEAYNGNNVNGTPNGPLNIKVSGGTVGNVFGGSKGSLAAANTTNVLITGGTIDNVYGGGNDAHTVVKSNVTIEQENGKTLLITGYTGDVITDGGTTTPIYGGVYGSGKGASAYVPSTNVNIGKATFTMAQDGSDGASVFGGGYKAGTDEGSGTSGNTVVNINTGATVYNVFGGSNQSGTVYSSTVNANAGIFTGNIYGGGNVAETNTTNVNLVGSISNNIIVNGGTDADTASEDVANAQYGNAFGGGKSADVTNSNVYLKGMTLNNVYGGSNQDGMVSNSHVYINYGTIGNAFGGNNAGGSTLHSNVTVDENSENNTLSVINVFGGSNGNGAYIGYRNRNTNPAPTITGTTLVELKKGTVKGNVYGGGNLAVVYGDTQVNMYDGTVDTIYGAGNMAHVGNYTTPFRPGDGTPYTGEYNTNAAYVESGRTSTVNIVGGTITGNVFGSGNAAFVHGQTYVNVGKSAIDAIDGVDNTYIKNISIMGTVFGGSYTVASELESYNFSSIGVVGKTNVVLDSTDYYDNDDKSIIELRGSIYGEGNNSTIIGNQAVSNPELSIIKVINYGNDDNPVAFASLARATVVEILDSTIELTGARNKQFREDKSEYSFVTIGNLYLLGTHDTDNPGGTTVYAKGGGTWLAKMYSGYKNGNTFVPETININTGETNGVVNRIYMPSRKVLAVSEGKVLASNPGTVHGIAFLGMYTHGSGNTFVRGIYDPDYTAPSGVVDDTTYALFDPESNFTYVYGSSSTDAGAPLTYVEEGGIRKTTIDGFYTNYVDPETKEFSTDYVGVTPKTENYYKWIIGKEVLEISVDLKASKYSMEASKNVKIEFEELFTEDGSSNGDVVFNIKSVKTSEFGQSITNSNTAFTASLINKADIPKIAETFGENGVTDANRKFAITMGTSSTGWKNNYSTNIYTSETDPYTGDTTYIYDSTTGARNLSFWLYHSKNIDTSYMIDPEGDIGLGNVSVDMEARNPNWGDATPDLPIVITINVYLTDDDQHDGYGYSIAPGKKYGTFAMSTPTIGTDGSFSIYHSLALDLNKEVAGKKDEYWSPDKAYDDDNYRYLSSKDKLPAGTRITMLDMIKGEQYFYEVTGNEVQNANSTYSYYLRDFISMSNVGGNIIHFDDGMDGVNSKYYKAIYENGVLVGEYGIEEFIFTFDFSSTNQNSYAANYELTSNIYLQLDGINDDTGEVETVLAPVFETGDQEMNYTVIKAGSSYISTDGGFVDDEGNVSTQEVFDIYRQTPATMLLETSLQNSLSNSNFTDTIYDDYQLGAKLTFYRLGEGNQKVALSYDTLDGLVVDVNGNKYYPENSESSGVIRLNLAGRISTLDSTVKLDFSNVSDAFVVGEYELCVETFGSYDGLYYNGIQASEKCFKFNLLSSDFGLVATAPEVEITHDVETGLDSEDNDVITYTVRSTNGIANPRLKISIQQFRSHNAGNYGDLIYNNKNICDFATKIEITSEDDTNKTPVTINCTGTMTDYYYDLGPIASGEVKNYTVKVTLKHGPNDDETDPSTSGWRSGTYRVLFTVFDRTTVNNAPRDTEIGSDYEYLIIRSLDVDEYGNGG